MKLSTNSLVVKAALIIAMAFVFTSASNAQDWSRKKPVVKPEAVANLIVGIKSENDGLRKCAIYYAGKYEVDQAVDALIEQLDVEKISKMRILIALSLYKIGNEDGLDAIYANALKESDPNVKRMCNAIVEEYAANKNTIASSVNYREE